MLPWVPSARTVIALIHIRIQPHQPPLIQVGPRRSEPHPPSCPAQTPESLGLSVSGRSPLEILVRTSQAHRRWLRVDNLHRVFVLVLRRGPGLCPLQFGLIHRPPPCPQPGQRLGTVPAFPAASKTRPYRGPQVPPHPLHCPPSNQRGSGLGGHSDTSPTTRLQTLIQPPGSTPFPLSTPISMLFLRTFDQAVLSTWNALPPTLFSSRSILKCHFL